MQILINVPEIRSEAYTSFGSSRRVVIFFAAVCCFVFNTFTSLLFSENNATSAPDITKVRPSKIARVIPRTILPSVGIARSENEIFPLNKRLTG